MEVTSHSEQNVTQPAASQKASGAKRLNGQTRTDVNSNSSPFVLHKNLIFKKRTVLLVTKAGTDMTDEME